MVKMDRLKYIWKARLYESSLTKKVMDEKYKKAIQKNWTTLVGGVSSDQVTRITDNLVQCDILTRRMKQDIEDQCTAASKMRQILLTLQKRGPLAFQALLDIMLICDATDLIEMLLFHIESEKAVL